MNLPRYLILLFLITAIAAIPYIERETGVIENFESKARVAKNMRIAETNKDYLLPDQQISEPQELYIEENGDNRNIRFDTYFYNIGKGPLELRGESDPEVGITVATQVITKTDGSKDEMKVGEFIFHPGHDHWHLERYAQFQLLRYNEDGKATELVASTDKFSFCIWDERPYDLELEGAPQSRQFNLCPQDIQGNSVGWGDVYASSFEGQELDIAGVEDGKYMVRSKVNADFKILESNYENNEVIVYIKIKDNTVTILENY